MTAVPKTRKAEKRANANTPALIGQKKARPRECENAVIEEMGHNTARIRSARPLKPKDSVVLYVGEKLKPLHSKVIRARREGFISTRRMGKPGQAFVAGCRLSEWKEPAEIGEIVQKAGKRALAASLQGLPFLVRWTIIAVGIGLAGTLTYGLISIGRLLH